MKAKRFELLKIPIVLVFLIVGVWSAAAQEPSTPRPPDLPIFTAEVNRVSLPVVVLAGRRQSISFRVFERRGIRGEFIEQKIERVERPGKLPIRAGILVDTSGSVGESSQFRYQKDVAVELGRLILRPLLKEERGDRVFVADFYYGPNDANPEEGIHRVRLDWANDIKSVVEAMAKLKPGGWSPLFGSIGMSSLKFLEDTGGDYSTFLLVISDGYHQMPENIALAGTASTTLTEAVGLAQSAHLAVYTIGTIDPGRFPPESEAHKQSQRNLSEIARLTGGRFFKSPKLSKLSGIANQIRSDLENRYHLEYGLNPEYKNGDEISTRVEVGEYDANGRWKKLPAKLLHRGGYRVTKSN